MFCCFQPSRRSSIDTKNEEKAPLLNSSTKMTINYQTIFAIPYQHVIRDDKIQIQPSDFMSTDTSDTYLFFNGTISNPAYESNQITCFSFDDSDVRTPVLFSTTTTGSHFLFERLFQVEHVSTINPSKTSSTTSMARPFDEFLYNPNVPNTSLDNVTPKTDKD